MLKKILLSLVGTGVFYGTACLLNIKLSIVFLAILIYILPMVFNIIMELLYPAKKKYQNDCIVAGITVIGYLVFGVTMMNQSGFSDYIVKNSVSAGDMYFSISSNLIHFPQLLFVFILNFGVLYLVQLFMEGKKKHVKGSKFK
ncbi:MAG: Msa family membrane protein [Lactobacillales bacterium]|nr:Msa family membrane protein [Lactobacillales bacterium]